MAESLNEPECDWRSSQRAQTEFYGNVRVALQYMLRRAGLDVATTKQLSFHYRRQVLLPILVAPIFLCLCQAL